MVPDFGLVAEIKLFSAGFLHSKKLAAKLVAANAMCSALLPTSVSILHWSAKLQLLWQ